ncbi:hypothetical protein PM082_018530 [Marasmius tenuissimus]|nr:hypothetical protein PM082_018530 [Marasmius tenuissimus]
MIKDLSDIDNDDWDCVPDSMNTGEAQHAWTNGETGIKLRIVKAIERAQEADSAQVRIIETAMAHGVQQNNNNELHHRMSRSIGRNSAALAKKKQAAQQKDKQDRTRAEINQHKALIKELQASLKPGSSRGTTCRAPSRKLNVEKINSDCTSSGRPKTSIQVTEEIASSSSDEDFSSTKDHIGLADEISQVEVPDVQAITPELASAGNDDPQPFYDFPGPEAFSFELPDPALPIGGHVTASNLTCEVSLDFAIDALDFAQVLQDFTTTDLSATQPPAPQWPSQSQINDDEFDALLPSFTTDPEVHPTQFDGDNTFEEILAQGFEMDNDTPIDPTFFNNPEGPFLHSIGGSAASGLDYGGDHSFLLPLPPSPTSSGLNSLPPSSPCSSFSIPDDIQFDASAQAGHSTSQQDSQAQEDRFWYIEYGPTREVGCTITEDNILAEGTQRKRKPVSSHTVVPRAVPVVSKKPSSSRKPPSKRQKV